MFKRFFKPASKNIPTGKMPFAIDFFCLEKDKPLKIILEPRAHAFTVNPGENIMFVTIAIHLLPDITGFSKALKFW